MKAIDKLRAYWNKKEGDIAVHYPGGIETKSDGRWLLCNLLTENALKELSDRGYDVKTLKFEIEPMKGNQRFTSQRAEDAADVHRQ